MDFTVKCVKEVMYKQKEGAVRKCNSADTPFLLHSPTRGAQRVGEEDSSLFGFACFKFFMHLLW